MTSEVVDMSSVASMETENRKSVGVADGLCLATAVSTPLVSSHQVRVEGDAVYNVSVTHIHLDDGFAWIEFEFIHRSVFVDVMVSSNQVACTCSSIRVCVSASNLIAEFCTNGFNTCQSWHIDFIASWKQVKAFCVTMCSSNYVALHS